MTLLVVRWCAPDMYYCAVVIGCEFFIIKCIYWIFIHREQNIPTVTRLTKQAFSCSKFLSPGGQLWANTAFEGSQFYSIGVPKFYSWVNVISVYVHNDLG